MESFMKIRKNKFMVIMVFLFGIISVNAQAAEIINIGNINIQNPANNQVSQASLTLTRTHNITWFPKDLPNNIVLGIPTFDNRSILYLETGNEYLHTLRSIFNKAQEWANTARQNNVNDMQRIIWEDKDIWAYGLVWIFQPLFVMPVFRVINGNCFLILIFQTTDQFNSKTMAGTQVVIPDSEIDKFLQIISEDNISQASERVIDLNSLFN